MTRVKICGVTDPENAVQCARLGADMIGLNFYPRGPRYVETKVAREIVQALRSDVGPNKPLVVGVFVNASSQSSLRMMDLLDLDAIQLSGDEPLDTLADYHGRAFKALRPEDSDPGSQIEAIMPFIPSDPDLPGALLDAQHDTLYGGTGRLVDPELALQLVRRVPRLLLAGGLNPDNVADRIRQVKPWGVDVASGVESEGPGLKDLDMVRRFVQAVNTANGSEEIEG